MHLSEGILPLRWAGFWYLIAFPFVAKGISEVKIKAKLNPHFKPLMGLLAAAVFIISCMPVPVPTAGTCSHPCGTGISAILIGPVMSILITSVALFIQALFLAHGGITTWGANIVSMGIAGSFTGYLVFKALRRMRASLFISGFAAGLLADWATYATTSFELASGLHGSRPLVPLFYSVLIAFIPTQLPLGILEGFLTGGMVSFVAKRRPDILASFGLKLSARDKLIKTGAKLIVFLLISFALLTNANFAFAKDNQNKWPGVDKSVVEKVAEEHGRKSWRPFIDTDQGDLLLFIFLLSGTAGGFVIGYNFRKLFGEKRKQVSGG